MPSASADTTVRQTPLTARLAPGSSSAASAVVIRSRNPSVVGLTSATSPIASINPVNIGLYLHVDADRTARDVRHPAARQDRTGQPRLPSGSERDRRHVQFHAIHQVGLPERLMERGASFD